jgi:hypothetical protein
MRSFKSILTAGMLCAGCAVTLISQASAQEPRITEKVARAAALARVPHGIVKTEELEKEKGHLIYSYDIAVPGRTGIEEVAVDAMTGKVLSVVHETPADEAKEAAADKKAAGARKH